MSHSEGIAGSRNVKWLRTIRFSKEECGSPWQKYFYKTGDGQSLQALPINSIITSHANDDSISPGIIVIYLSIYLSIYLFIYFI
jgi:hypothetical protein